MTFGQKQFDRQTFGRHMQHEKRPFDQINDKVIAMSTKHCVGQLTFCQCLVAKCLLAKWLSTKRCGTNKTLQLIP